MGGESYIFNGGLNDQSHLVELQNNSYFIVCYSDGPNNEYDTECRVGQYDYNVLTILFGDLSFNMTQNVPTNGMDIARISNNAFISCFAAYTNKIGVCFVGTVENNFGDGVNSKILYGNQIIFNGEGGTDKVNIVHVNSTVLIICYMKNNGGSCKFGIVELLNNGRYDIQIQSNEFDFEYNSIESPSIFLVPADSLDNDLNPELLGICYVDERSGVCRFDENDTNSFDDQGIGTIVVRYLSNSKVVVCYVDF